MNNLQPFNNPEFGTIRTLEKDNEVWFIGKDVAEILGYSNTRDALTKHVDSEDKAGVAIHDGRQNRSMISSTKAVFILWFFLPNFLRRRSLNAG